MDISIIIPVFNQAEILKITLEHFCAQMKTNENLQTEIIIVDDGSTDNIKQIVKRYVESENKIRIISLLRKIYSILEKVALQTTNIV